MPRSLRNAQRKAEAARLRELRGVLGLTQRELATEFNVAHGAIAAWENGNRTLPGPVLKLMSLYEEELGLAPRAATLERLRTSRWARQAALSRTAGGILARVGATALERMLADDVHANAITARAHTAVARSLVDALGNLKGVALKFGQALSYLDFLLPEESRRELQTLLVTSRAMSASVISQVVMEELGEPPRRLFSEWCAQPFASGSIGQVHRARLRSGQEVAVKIQYPAIVQAIQADLAAASLMDRMTSLLFRAQQPGVVLDELRERFLEECDYRIEAENQEQFRTLWRGHPKVHIPRVHRELSTSRVLVTDFAHGENFESFLQHASPAERDCAGMLLWRFAFESIFRHGLFNADPHPGNYLFAQGRVVFLDFGCVKRFDPRMLGLWRGMIRGVLEGDAETAHRLWMEAGMIPDPSRFDAEYHRHMLLTLYEPWLGAEPYRFEPEFVERTWRALVLDNPNRFRTNLPKDWVFVNRLQWGLYAVLARLGAKGAFRNDLLDLLYSPHERRPNPLTYTARLG
ncbi:MAG TPA: AarF/UbiB family protein [Polyangiaceae bacterium]|nr:AarF/UbiB family protein [Polyangiaceae bacterium]